MSVEVGRLQIPSQLMELHDPVWAEADVRLLFKRDDLIHSQIPGNKWRKLRLFLDAARAENAETLLTFGGAYSNHLYATAAAGRLGGFQTIGVVRGERREPLNPVLSFCQSAGMRLHYLDREAYRHKNEPDNVARLRGELGDCFVIPEGGAHPLGVRGATEIVSEIDESFDFIVCPTGTGTTLAGLAVGCADRHAEAIGVAVLKGADFLHQDVDALIRGSDAAAGPWRLVLDYHFGGYAKRKPELREFSLRFQALHQVQIDRIYVGKMLFGLYDMLAQGAFAPGQTVIAVHTGGLPDEFE